MDADFGKQLSDPFPANDVEWRVQQSGLNAKGKPWVMVIPYITNRAIQKRLDDVCGCGKWKNEFKPTSSNEGYLCGISIKIGDEWVTKWDGAELTAIEPTKGGLSNSMKRAAVQWGIGRYLYSLETEFAACSLCKSRGDAKGVFINIKDKKTNKIIAKAQWFIPELPEWAKPHFQIDKLKAAIKASETIEELDSAFKNAEHYAGNFDRKDILDEMSKMDEDRRKSIINKQQEESEKSSIELRDWLAKSIDDFVYTSGNQSSLSACANQINAELKNRSRGELFKELKTQLNEAFKNQKSKINEANKNG